MRRSFNKLMKELGFKKSDSEYNSKKFIFANINITHYGLKGYIWFSWVSEEFIWAVEGKEETRVEFWLTAKSFIKSVIDNKEYLMKQLSPLSTEDAMRFFKLLEEKLKQYSTKDNKVEPNHLNGLDKKANKLWDAYSKNGVESYRKNSKDFFWVKYDRLLNKSKENSKTKIQRSS